MKYKKIIKSISMFIIIFSYLIILSSGEYIDPEYDYHEYGIVEAWFNGEPATVEGISMKVGETAEVKVNVTSKINGDISILLKEPGFTNAFDVINGPSMMGQWTDDYNVEKNWSKEFIWTVKVNGKWVDGNAPINIIVQFTKPYGYVRGYDSKEAYFSVANPFILNERFSGALPGPTPPAPSVPSSSPPLRSAPGFGLLLALCALVGALLLARWR